MLPENHNRRDYAAVLFAFAKGDDGYQPMGLSWRGAEIYLASM
jgi:hypothetical protein